MLRLFRFFILFLFSVALFDACSVCRHINADSISPLDYGLMKAQTGEERFEVLFKTHEEALRLGKGVDYSGIKKIDLEIPKGAKSIPLSENTNFRGTIISVVNNSKDFFLFEYKKKMIPISASATEVDNCRYTTPDLKSGLFLLSITDGNPWVVNREGFNYGATRKDLILIENGKGKDGPCSPYSTKASSPVYLYREVTDKAKTFSNLEFIRLSGSSKLTKLVRFSCENNVQIENISITTPEGSLYGDQAICAEDCSNVLLKNIIINGTYSTTEKFGYGISMNNVWNVSCKNIQSKTAWGVFGTNNTHKVHLENCNIDRFDVHCYGKDILCDNCTFNGMGGVYSSVFGTIEYRGCVFNEARLYINRADYNAYVFFNLVLKDCIINPTKNRPYLINLQSWSDKINEREELKTKCWPNVSIENLTVNVPEGIDAMELFRVPKKFTNKKPIAGLSAISIKGLVFKYKKSAPAVSLKISSTEVQLENPFVCLLEGIKLLPDEDGAFSRFGQNQDKGIVVVNMKNSKGEDVIVKGSRIDLINNK